MGRLRRHRAGERRCHPRHHRDPVGRRGRVYDRPVIRKAGPLHDQIANMDACIRCGLCLSACPTYQITLMEEESPRGRIAAARALADGAIALTPDVIAHQRSCLLCEACTAICPAGFRMEDMGIALRNEIRQRAGSGGGLALRLALRGPLAHPWQLRLLSRSIWLYQRSGLRWLLRHSGALRLLRLRRADRLLPAMPARFFVAKGQHWPPSGDAAAGAPRIGLLAGCVMSTALSGVDFATARVLAAAGCEVIVVAGQGCCGSLAAHNGFVAEARQRARRTIDAFEREQLDAIVVNAAGCGAAMKGYGHLLANDASYRARAPAFSAKVRDLSEFLAERPSFTRAARRVDATVTYQEPCHLAHAQRIRSAPRTLLEAVPGLRLVEMAESAMCCGSAGVYNLTQGESADALLERKLDNALATGAEIIVTANPGCQLQLAAGLAARGSGVRVMHLAEVLDLARDVED
ncbi:MAG: 4Fe-4S dicluster domain-containing protein [Dehalococcoidia bacterium]|nr:4Fe-4S dicluster domain-containing protein [Dehalococcoidia bacterium]